MVKLLLQSLFNVCSCIVEEGLHLLPQLYKERRPHCRYNLRSGQLRGSGGELGWRGDIRPNGNAERIDLLSLRLQFLGHLLLVLLHLQKHDRQQRAERIDANVAHLCDRLSEFLILFHQALPGVILLVFADLEVGESREDGLGTLLCSINIAAERIDVFRELEMGLLVLACWDTEVGELVVELGFDLISNFARVLF